MGNQINEAQTRREIIDKRLKKAGWDVSEPTQITTELDIWVGLPEGVTEAQHEHQGHQYVDYVLLGENGYPLAVVEAKKTSKDARVGQEQARQYAENIAKNSGKEIEENDYDLSLNRYKEVTYEAVEYEKPEVILGKIEKLEEEIMEGVRKLKEMKP
jgi:type I site-specific restriction endonuclease